MKRYIVSSESEHTVVVHTGLTDQRALDVLQSVVGQLSDGIWENSSRMEPYWHNLNVRGGDIIFSTRSYSSPFRGKSEQELKTWFANKVKQVVKTEEEWNGSSLKWSRDNETISDYLDRGSGVRVKDAYRVYDALLGRKPRIDVD